MQLTKTDFIQYLNCSKSLWVLKHEPENYPHGEFSVFLQKLTREGYEVERYVRQFFQTAEGRTADFQSVFESDDGLFAKVDALEKTTEGEVILYEVKSSTSVKTDASHNHIKDVCFQKICAERAGQQIDRVYLVHLNGNYTRTGEVDPAALLTFTEITKKVDGIISDTEVEIDGALDLLREVELDRDGCTCLYKSRGNHCDTFSLFNPDIPTPSIYSLPRLSAKKRADFVKKGIFDLHHIPVGYPLSTNQQSVVQAVMTGAPRINLKEIRGFLAGLSFPLYFLDYETYASAVPIVDGGSPHKQFPVQYSLHILDAHGTLRHKEFLERESRLPDPLLTQLQTDIGPQGSIISWHASFEKSQNQEMAVLFPNKAQFLKDLNDRMVDIEEPFKAPYVDARFDGSTSIKKVLPVICPELSYDDLEIQGGSSAMVSWERLINATPEEAERIAGALFDYCERDTMAMVEIFRFLNSLR